MKKQNVNNKLAFNKAAVMELNDHELNDVNGGTTPICAAAIASSATCIHLAATIIGVIYYK